MSLIIRGRSQGPRDVALPRRVQDLGGAAQWETGPLMRKPWLNRCKSEGYKAQVSPALSQQHQLRAAAPAVFLRVGRASPRCLVLFGSSNSLPHPIMAIPFLAQNGRSRKQVRAQADEGAVFLYTGGPGTKPPQSLLPYCKSSLYHSPYKQVSPTYLGRTER